jgi:XTP/dITP diphosphohydrolase
MLRKEGRGTFQGSLLMPTVCPTVLIATSNAGKLRDFAGAAVPYGVTILGIPDFHLLSEVVEDGLTFDANARKKAAGYSLSSPGEIILADDSGLEVDALHGAPGVHSARYAALESGGAPAGNSPDDANNARLLRELASVAPERKTARFVCRLAAARDGDVLAVFSGKAEGLILTVPRGTFGFGYDPLFFFPSLKKTFAELSAEEKASVSHRGAAFRQFLEWIKRQRFSETSEGANSF